MEDNRNDQGPGKGVVVEDLLSENVWRALILTSAAAVIILSVYCLTHGITIIFMHLYYLPIVLLAYRYRYRGFMLATLLSLAYVGLVVIFQPEQAEVTGAFYRFAVFIGIAAVIAYLSERLAAAHSSQKEGLDTILNLQQFQESVITNANVWITVLAPDGTTIIVWNDAAEAISGYKRGEVLGKRTIWRALYPDKEYRKKVTREIQQIIGRDTYLENFETEIRCADGTQKTIVWNTRGIRDPTGTIQSYIAIGRDITEQKRAEKALRESETLLNEVGEMAHVGGWELDVRTKAVHWTKETYRIHDISENEKFDLSKAVLFFDMPDRSRLEGALQRCMETGEPFDLELPFTSAKGRHLWTRAMGRAVSVGGEVVKLTGTFQDITEHRQAEEALRQSEERYRTLSESSPDQIFIIGRDDTMKYANAAALKLFRLPYDQVVGKPRKDLFPPGIAKSQEASLKKVFETGEHVRKLESIQFGKQEFWIDTSLVPLNHEDGSVTSVLGIARDITEHKQAEEKLKFSNVLLSTQQEVSIDGILVVDESGKIISFNRRFIEIWGIPQDVVASRSDERTLQSVIGKLANPEEFIARVKYLYANRDEKSREEITLKDGRVLDRYSAPMSGSDGTYYGRIWNFRDITDRKRAEEHLKESEEKYREFFTTSRDCVFITSPGGQWIDFNDVALEMFGYASREELSKVPVPQLYENPSERTAFLNSIIRQGYAKEFPARLRRKDGAVIDTLITTVPVKNPDGSTRAFVGTIRDITDRKQAEEKLKVSEELYRALVETTGTGYVIIDKDGKVLDANPEYVRLTGHHTLEEISGRSVIEWTAGYEKEKNADAVKKCARDGYIRNLEIDYVDSTGSVIPVEITATVVEIEGTIRILTLCRDITDRKRLEGALRTSEERFRGITERISDLIIIVNPEGYMTFVSPSITSILGFPPESYIGKRAGPDIIHAEDVVKIGQAMEKVKNGSPGEQVEFRMSKSDGSYAVFDGKGIPIFTKGIFAGVQVVARDITERKRVEEALRDSKNRSAMLLEAVPDMMFIVSRDGVYRDFSVPDTSVLAVPVDQIIGTNIRDSGFKKESTDAIMHYIGLTLDMKKLQQFEYDLVMPDGEHWYESRMVALSEDSVLGIVRDITERKRTEEERERIRSWRAGVNRILESVLAPAPLDQKLKIITDGVVETFGVDFCRIWLIDKGDLCSAGCMHAEAIEGPHACRYRDKCLHLKASSGRYTHINGKAHRRIPFAAYKIGRIASGEDTKFLTNDVEHDPRVHNHEWAKNLGLVAFSGYRLKPPDSDVLGVFALFARFPISPDMDAILDGLSRAISLVIQKDIADKALRDSEQKFRDIFNNTTDAIHLHEIRDDGTPGKFTDINDVACRLLQYTKEEMLAKTPLDITTGYHNPPIERVFEEQRTTGSAKFETEHRRKDGTIIPVEVNTHVVVIEGKKVMLGVVRDITERKKAEALLKQFNEELEQKVKIRTEELNASLDEKVILLREVHHRVKNNLQILISLLNLQSRTITDPQVIAALKESTQRIRAMSMVHEKLHSGSDLAHIEFVSYLSWLANSQVSFYQLDPGKVTIETTGENIMLDINTAIPLGLVMNELVSNALKHAFPGDRKGTIRIDAREKADRLEITLSDNGIGIPEGFDWKTAPSLGLRLVNILIDQLSGTIELDRSAGTAFTIVVKEQE